MINFTVAIADIIISEGLSLNLDNKSRSNKVLDPAIKNRKDYILPDRNIISKELFYVMH